ncbi:DUF1786 family protein [Thermodesulfobacteriota bacterium]
MKILLIDIGAGTMDILYYDTELMNHYKAVVKSPVLSIAGKLKNLEGNIIITGVEMGGGSMSAILREKAKKNEVIMSLSASATVNHDVEKVRSTGVIVVDDEEAENIKESGKYKNIDISDLQLDRIKGIVEGMGVPFSFDVLGLCAQDHGISEPGVSHLDFRHNIFKEKLDSAPFPHEMLYEYDEIPATFNRLKSIAQRAKLFPTDEIYVMDSGMAAILGGTLDPVAIQKNKIIVLDIATSHTVGAAFEYEELAGFFEYHTMDITKEILEYLLIDLANGRLDHAKILEQGGHGAYIRKPLGYHNLELILSTGPRRELVYGSRLDITPGAPLGDNMMTGTAGILEAIRRRKRLDTFDS